MNKLSLVDCSVCAVCLIKVQINQADRDRIDEPLSTSERIFLHKMIKHLNNQKFHERNSPICLWCMRADLEENAKNNNLTCSQMSFYFCEGNN